MTAPKGGFMAMGPQSRWRRVLLLALLPMLAAFFYYASTSSHSFLPHAHPPPPSPDPHYTLPFHQHSNTTVSSDDVSMMTVMKALYEPVLHPVAAPNFTDEDGETFYLPKGEGAPRFKKGLDKRVLILDVDSRPLGSEGQILSKELKWKGLRPLAAGMLSHYMYALIHGYTYKFIHAPSYIDRWGTWTKVPMMLSALRTQQFDYIVFMDSDVVMHYPHLPIEWLLNYWDVQPGMLAAMSIDPDEPQNYDDRGNRYLNTGFVILQNDRDAEGIVDGVEGKGSRLELMLTRWAECPDEGSDPEMEPIDVTEGDANTDPATAKPKKGYKGCKPWKLDWPHEQAAFGRYVRYDPLFSSRPALAAEKEGAPPEDTYAKGETIKVLPCVEANGAPEAENRGGCKGLFVRHYWVDKGKVAGAVSDGILQYWLPRLHRVWKGESDVSDVPTDGEATTPDSDVDEDAPEGSWTEKLEGEETSGQAANDNEDAKSKVDDDWIDSGNIVDAKGFEIHGAELVELHGEMREGVRKGKGTSGANLKEEGW